MKLVTVTVQVAFLDETKRGLASVKNILDRALVDGLEAEVIALTHEQEWDDPKPDIDYSVDDVDTQVEDWKEYALEALAKRDPLQAIRAILVDKNDQWRTDQSGADVVDRLTQTLTAHSLGATNGDDTEDLGQPEDDGLTVWTVTADRTTTYEVKALNEDDAIDRMMNGEGKEVDGTTNNLSAHEGTEDDEPDGDLPNMSPLGGGNR